MMNSVTPLRLIRLYLRPRPTPCAVHSSKAFSTHPPRQTQASKATPTNVEDLLSNPTWSVSSLLPPKDVTQPEEISSQQLHHLLRLSALPPPKDAAEEDKMRSTLASQLHFVKEIQKVDTAGVEPLRSLRDETQAGESEAEIGMEAMKDALALEEVRGKHHKRIKRRDSGRGKNEGEWDALCTAERKIGRFFVVEGGKDG